MTRSGVALLALLGVLVAGSVAQAGHPPPSKLRTSAAVGPAEPPPARALASASGDDRRYALAGGCYAMRSRTTGGLVAKSLGGYGAAAGPAAAAEGFRMQATALGRYLRGLSSQPEPRAGVEYPFRSPLDDGVTFERQRSGSRRFDFATHGVAHYGMFPDWWEDIRRAGGGAALRDMARGAEAYLQSWERVTGIPSGCKLARQRFTPRGLGRLRLRAGTGRLLRRGGQPRARGSRAWRWCVRGRRNKRKKHVAVLTRRGKVALVVGNARGSEARRTRVRDPATRARERARKLGAGLFVRSAGRRARTSTACAAAGYASSRWARGGPRGTAGRYAAT